MLLCARLPYNIWLTQYTQRLCVLSLNIIIIYHVVMSYNTLNRFNSTKTMDYFIVGRQLGTKKFTHYLFTRALVQYDITLKCTNEPIYMVCILFYVYNNCKCNKYIHYSKNTLKQIIYIAIVWYARALYVYTYFKITIHIINIIMSMNWL